MSVRSTSLEAYCELHGSGARQNQAYRILRALRPGKTYTLNEIERKTGIRINAVSGRVNELKACGFLVEGERRECTVSKRSCLPVMRPKVTRRKMTVAEMGSLAA
jgi:hypothetical protein